MARRLKNSCGIWAFGPNGTRFVPSGYHPEATQETMIQRTERAVRGLDTLIDGFEYHYPSEIDEHSVEAIKRVLGSKDIYALALGLFSDPRYALGSLINPDRSLRRRAIDTAKAGVDMAAALSAHFIIWPGAEGYNYPFQADYTQMWNDFIGGLAEIVAYANEHEVKVFLEHKNSEPAMKILMRDLGMTMWLIRKIADRGVSTTNVQVNMDWQHLIMNGENLPEYAVILHNEGLLGHQHGNSGWGSFDDDNMVGASFFMQTLGLARVLRDVGYGSHGERIGYDLYPYTEDQVQAVRQSIIQWEFIDSLAGRLDLAALRAAEAQRDAVRAYQIVYETLGLNEAFVQGLLRG
ncbi:MAG: sugar phosphate isomerase/epimerase [Chloroflexi bacterium]|nr:sugar phosphate isomerase/epimerase [Chloroflexota bacterium]